jgi:drug/metabolite transporter (DMT)-like permease
MAAMLALALISTALAYVIFFRILKRAGSTNLSLVTLLIPPSALMLSILFLGEELSPHHFLGMALIGFGLLLLDGRVFRLRRRA